MPFGEDLFPDLSPPPPPIQSDLLGSVEDDFSREPFAAEGAGQGLTVVTLDDQGPVPVASGPPEADMGLDAGAEAKSPVSAPSTAKKRGRPSLSASATTATPARSTVTARTPRSAKSVETVKSAGRSTDRKRKAPELEAEQEPEPKSESEQEPEPEPDLTPVPKKRGRPARTAGAAKAAKKPTRGRPKSSTQPAQKPAKRAGRPRKDTTANGEVPEGEYEVEEIVESAIDASTMQHMYLVKWKGYSESENTWEPKKNLKGALDLVREFDAKKKKAEAEAAAKRVSVSDGEKKTRAASATKKQPKAVKPVKKGKGPGRPAGRRRRSRA